MARRERSRADRVEEIVRVVEDLLYGRASIQIGRKIGLSLPIHDMAAMNKMKIILFLFFFRRN